MILLVPGLTSAQEPARALDYEAQEPAVVMLALSVPECLILQRDIAKAALEAGPVVVFFQQRFPDDKKPFYADPIVKKAIDQGRVIFAAVPHDTQWIRDYGPQIRHNGSKFTLIDPVYSDIRREISIDEQRKEINLLRKSLTDPIVNQLKREFVSGAGKIVNPFDKKNANAQSAKDLLYVLEQHEKMLLSTKEFDRQNDDRAPYEMMQVVTDLAEIDVDRSKLYLDGGNTLHLSDRTLFSTKDLFLRNPGNEGKLRKEIMNLFDVDNVEFLEPLPATIPHVDMFLLPAIGKRVLLASYPTDQKSTQLTKDAAAAMEKNKAKLKKLGYEVIDVPSLPPSPASPFPGDFYPTMLNAVTLKTAAGGFLVLVPYYPQSDPYIQFAAHKKIREAFGGNAKVIPIDCSSSARMQGAIHCLTATVPYRFSRFHLPNNPQVVEKTQASQK